MDFRQSSVWSVGAVSLTSLKSAMCTKGFTQGNDEGGMLAGRYCILKRGD